MAVTFSLRGTKEARQLLDSLSGRELKNRTRRGTRAGAKVFRGGLVARVGSGRYPRSFRKIATKGHRDGATSVGPTSPLLPIFEVGARPHPIGAAGQLLVNTAAGFLARGPVRHPGMNARPLIGPTFEAEHDAAGEAAMEKILEGLR